MKINTAPKITYPKRLSEFEIHSLLFYKLKKKYNRQGFVVRGEVGGSIGLKKNRFDIVIFLDRIPVVIVEVKKSYSGVSAKQMNEYMKYNVPLIYCNNKGDIKNVMKSLEYHFNKMKSNKILLRKSIN